MSNNGSKLDFRFADELDGIELASFINLVIKDTEQNESNPYYFRNMHSEPILTIEELETDLISMPIKWLVLETPIPEEDIVGAARLTCDRNKIGRVDIIFAAGYDQIHKSIMKRLLSIIETVSYNMGLQEVIIEIPEWRTDIQDILTIDCKYIEQSGYMWPESKSSQIIKPTMILAYHKCFKESNHNSIECNITESENFLNLNNKVPTHELPQLIQTLFTALHKEYDNNDTTLDVNPYILNNVEIDIPIINMEDLDL